MLQCVGCCSSPGMTNDDQASARYTLAERERWWPYVVLDDQASVDVEVGIGFGRIVALYHRSSTLFQIH
jgi:hypothetical protein